MYFHAYNARKREEKLMHDKAVRRVHIEMHKYNKAKKMNPQARLPTEWMHRANETTTDLALARKRRGKPRRPNPAAMRLPERTIYVDLSLDFVGPEVAGEHPKTKDARHDAMRRPPRRVSPTLRRTECHGTREAPPLLVHVVHEGHTRGSHTSGSHC